MFTQRKTHKTKEIYDDILYVGMCEIKIHNFIQIRFFRHTYKRVYLKYIPKLRISNSFNQLYNSNQVCHDLESLDDWFADEKFPPLRYQSKNDSQLFT